MFGAPLLALRAFVLGALVGVLVALRAGAETRRLLASDLALLSEALADLLGLRHQAPPLPERAAREPERAARA